MPKGRGRSAGGRGTVAERVAPPPKTLGSLVDAVVWNLKCAVSLQHSTAQLSITRMKWLWLLMVHTEHAQSTYFFVHMIAESFHSVVFSRTRFTTE